LHTTSALYKLLLFALSPLALVHVIYRSLKDGGRRYFKQRLGFGYRTNLEQPIHIHCASVGEFLTAKPLIESIHASYPEKHLVITTNTPTAASLVKKLHHINITHYYFPIDLSFSVNNFLKITHPQCVIILETELWPSFYYAASKKNIPIIIINARLST
jgi:3-deoxy-D-manno-octulosonic-acid transferase